MDEVNSSERFDSTTTTLVVLTIALVALLNWPYEFVGGAITNHHSTEFSELSANHFMFDKYEMISGGFPFRYLVREEDDVDSRPQFWSPMLLIVDLCMGVFLVLAVGIGSFRSRRKHLEDSPDASLIGDKKGKFRKIVTATIICGLLVSFLGVFARRQYVHNQRVTRLKNVGILVEYAIVPKPILGFVPRLMLLPLTEIRAVTLMESTPELIDEIASLGSIRSIAFSGQSPSPQQVERLAKRNDVKYFGLRGVVVNDELKRAILSLSGLRQLEILQCRGLADGIEGINELSRLQHLRIVDSDLNLSSIPSQGWPTSLVSLHVSRKKNGSDKLDLSEIISLKSLSIARNDNQLNADLLRISIRDMPALERLVVENLQKMAIEIDNAPRLQSLVYAEQDLLLGSRSSFYVPTSPWLESLSLTGLPSLREIHIDGLDLISFKLDGLPNLQHLSLGRFGVQSIATSRNPSAEVKARMQHIINAIGRLDVPRVLDLSSLPLAGVDLSPLANNRRIRQLILAKCGIEGRQLSEIAKIPGLQSVDLRHCPIADEEARRFLRSKEDLEDLLVCGEDFKNIDLVDQANLRGYLSTDALRAENVRIQNCPELAVELVFGDRVEKLQIRDARSILGLSINGPLPRDSELHGFRSLRFFAVGGENATDTLCKHLWQCRELDHLTIAYGNLSRASLARVGALHRLTVLSLPGAAIDDSLVMENWQQLQMLSDVNLSDTSVSKLTCDFLSSQNNLQKLVLNHCNVDKSHLGSLVQVKQLIELDVAAIGLLPQTLEGCLQKGMLDRLDLSESEVSDRMVEILSSPLAHSLQFLGLNECNLSDAQVRRIVDAHPKLALDLNGNQLSDDLLDSLEKQGRLIDSRDRLAFLHHLSRTSGIERSIDDSAELDLVRGRINPHQFITSRSSRLIMNRDHAKVAP